MEVDKQRNRVLVIQAISKALTLAERHEYAEAVRGLNTTLSAIQGQMRRSG